MGPSGHTGRGCSCRGLRSRPVTWRSHHPADCTARGGVPTAPLPASIGRNARHRQRQAARRLRRPAPARSFWGTRRAPGTHSAVRPLRRKPLSPSYSARLSRGPARRVAGMGATVLGYGHGSSAGGARRFLQHYVTVAAFHRSRRTPSTLPADLAQGAGRRRSPDPACSGHPASSRSRFTSAGPPSTPRLPMTR